MNQITIRTRAIREFNDIDVQQRVQLALIEHKEETGMSDEQILRDMDRVLLHPDIKIYTPMRGDIGGWQEQVLYAEMQGTRRSLTNFRKVDKNGNIKHPPRDPMYVLVREAYLIGYYALEERAKKKIQSAITRALYRFQHLGM
jgi:hypothetical protein